MAGKIERYECNGFMVTSSLMRNTNKESANEFSVNKSLKKVSITIPHPHILPSRSHSSI